MSIKLQRDELYADVWQHPIGHLARRMGVTSAKLREACKAMAVPLPAVGHWAAARAGTAPDRTPLPPHAGLDTYTIGTVPRESLVEWVTAARPKQTSGPTRSPPQFEEVPNQNPGPRYVLLQEWAAAVFGERAPHQNTLLRWIHDGRIQPSARKIGRRWWVVPGAEYVED